MLKRLKRFLKSKPMLVLYVFVLFVYLNNTSLFTSTDSEGPWLMAHRGLAQTFHMENLKNDTCTAERIYPPEHPYLENSIPSMEAAIQAKADVVEFDIQLTKDGEFAVFHDATLGCRTDVQGSIKDFTMAELKKLDIGYGYTADEGKTYPFRGKGVGLMPSLKEVLARFPDQPFMLHIKSNSTKDGEQLVKFLSEFPKERLAKLTVYGGDNPVGVVREQMPDMRVVSIDAMKSCLLPYLAVGWTGYTPSACQNIQLHLPEKIAPFLWGWPAKFVNRMDEAGSRVVVVAGWGGFSEGFDQPADLDRLPKKYTGGIWTNRIDRIAPIVKAP